jgi:hypothetical protein
MNFIVIIVKETKLLKWHKDTEEAPQPQRGLK